MGQEAASSSGAACWYFTLELDRSFLGLLGDVCVLAVESVWLSTFSLFCVCKQVRLQGGGPLNADLRLRSKLSCPQAFGLVVQCWSWLW